MKFYVDEYLHTIVTEDEAKVRTLERDIDCGAFDIWINDHYTATDILTDRTLTVEQFKEEYMKACDLEYCGYYSVEISEKAEKAIAEQVLEKNQSTFL